MSKDNNTYDFYIIKMVGCVEPIEQSFTASDQVEREDKYGDAVQIDVNKEVYQPLNMEQPK